MGRILGNWRIALSGLFSAALIAGAFFLARDVGLPQAAEASAESALLQAIAKKDTDGDGLSDWEEALYGTSPAAVDTFHLGMTDGEAVAKGLIVPKAIADIRLASSSPTSIGADGLPPPPAEGTLTAAFAQNFFTLYLAAKRNNGGGNLTQSGMAQVASDALRSLSSVIVPAPDFKSTEDLIISGSGPEALAAFAANAEAVLVKNRSTASMSEINYLKSAVETNDDAALAHIASIAKGYRDAAAGLAALTVPAALAADHLALINSMMRMSEIATDFTRVHTDVLATILALQQYPQTVLALGNAFIHINAAYKSAGVSIPAGAPGASFVNLIPDVMASQRDAPKP